MKTPSTSETEMRQEQAPTPDTIQELCEYIESLTDIQHDYGTCVYAMSLAATAAFNHMARKLGVTGFQASCADLDFIRRVRHMKAPFALIDANNMCYPQYDLHQELDERMNSWMPWVSEECKRLLGQKDQYGDPHPDVLEHWEKMASYKPETEEQQ